MKNLALLVLLMQAAAAWSQSSTYNVIKVNGEIFNITQSVQMSQGNSLYAQDELNFRATHLLMLFLILRKNTCCAHQILNRPTEIFLLMQN